MNVTRSQAKSLLGLLLLLLVSNGILLFMLLNKTTDRPEKNRDRSERMRTYLKDELKFSDGQLASFDSLNKISREKMDAEFKAGREKRGEYLKAIGASGFNDSLINTEINRNMGKMQEMEREYLNNLKAIRSIGTPAQQAIFDTGFYKAVLRPRK